MITASSFCHHSMEKTDTLCSCGATLLSSRHKLARYTLSLYRPKLRKWINMVPMMEPKEAAMAVPTGKYATVYNIA